MNLPDAIITGPGAEDGYYLGIISTTGQTVTGVSIFQDALSAGTTVSAIQCGRDDSGDAEYGFALQSRGLESVTEIPAASNGIVFAESPYSSATAAIGHFAGMVRSLYLRAAVASVNALTLSVTLEDGPWQGNTIVAQVDFANSLVASDFSVGERVLLRNWPDREPVVVGWWEAVVGQYPAVFIEWDYAAGEAYLRWWDGVSSVESSTVIVTLSAVVKGLQYTAAANAVNADMHVLGIGSAAGKTMNVYAGGFVTGLGYDFNVLRSDTQVDVDIVSEYWGDALVDGEPLAVPYNLGSIHPVNGNITRAVLSTRETGEEWQTGGNIKFAQSGTPTSADFKRYIGI